jgi:Uma2 family endonuclease
MVSSNAEDQGENGMADAIPAPLSIEAFRAWVESRPEKERWELIGGVPMIAAPATRDHQRITSNLEWLLNDALEAHHPEFSAYQRVGLNLASIVPDYDPEPDVAVISANECGDVRYSDRFFLAAEIVSASDQNTIDAKREIYKRHPDCRCVLIIHQDRYRVGVAARTQTAWTERQLAASDDMLVLEDFGLRCTLADLYRGTALQPRGKR